MSQISLPWQRWSLGEKFAWHHSKAHPRKPPYIPKKFSDISSISQDIANYVAKFVAMANSVGSIQWPILENLLIDAKILQISLTQTEL